MKTTVCAIGGRRVIVGENNLTDGHILLVIEHGYSVPSLASFDHHGAAVLGQALLDLAKKIEDDKLFPAALTSGINWQEVNDIARGNV